MARRSRKEHLEFATARILLIDNCQATRNVRVAILRERGIDVHTAENLEEARFLWQPMSTIWYCSMSGDICPEKPSTFIRDVKDCASRQRIAFLLGAPRYLSLTWPDEFEVIDERRPQWEETVRCLAAAA